MPQNDFTEAQIQETKTVLSSLKKLLSGDLNQATFDTIEKLLRDISSTAVMAAVLEHEIELGALKGTALQIAIQRISLALVETLISFDPNVDIDTLKIDELISISSDSDKRTLGTIKTFISSREKLSGCTKKISLNRTVRLLENGIDAIPADISEDLVLIYGETQTGKSSWLNYLHGTNYQYEIPEIGVMPRAKFVSGNEQIFMVGSGQSSETIYPKLASTKIHKDVNYRFVDMPGFGDTRNIAERICVMASNKMLLHKLKKAQIKGIMFVIPYDYLTQGGYTNLRKILPKMKRLLNGQYVNFIFVVTKLPQDPNLASELKLNQQLKEILNTITAEVNDSGKGLSDDSEIIKDKKDTIEILQNILHPNRHIILGDIFNFNARNQIIDDLKKIISKSSDQFNFDVSFTEINPMDDFKNAMECVAKEYNRLHSIQETNDGKILGLDADMGKERTNLASKQEAMAVIKADIGAPITLDSDTINRLTKEVSDLDICIKVGTSMIVRLQSELESLNKEIEELRTNQDPYRLDSFTKVFQQYPVFVEEKNTGGILNRIFGKIPESSSCNTKDSECIIKNQHALIEAREHGRVKNEPVIFELKQPYQDYKISIADYSIVLIGCGFEKGVWKEKEFLDALTHNEEFQKSLKDGVFQGRVHGARDDHEQLIMGDISVSVVLFGSRNTKKETLDKIVSMQTKISIIEESLKLEEGILDSRKLEKFRKENEIVRLNSAPKEAEVKKDGLLKKLAKLEKEAEEIINKISELENQKKIYIETQENNEAILKQAFFLKIVRLLDILVLTSNELAKFSISVKIRFGLVIEADKLNLVKREAQAKSEFTQDEFVINKKNGDAFDTAGAWPFSGAKAIEFSHNIEPIDVNWQILRPIFCLGSNNQTEINRTLTEYKSSIAEQLILLQWSMQFLTGRLPWNKVRELKYWEAEAFLEDKNQLELFYEKLNQLDESIIAKSGLFEDQLCWLDKTIREMYQGIRSILKKYSASQSQIDYIDNKITEIKKLLDNLVIKEEKLLRMEEQSSALAANGERYAITYDCIRDVLKFRIEKIEPEKNISFSPLAFSQNTRFSQQQQFWARREMPVLIEAVVDVLPTTASEDMGQLPRLGY